MHDRFDFNPDTIKKIYFFELKYALRENSLKILFLLPIIIILMFLMVGEFKHLVFGINEFYILAGIFIFDSELFINQFSIIKGELRFFRLFSSPVISLIMAKNIFAFTFVLFQCVAINIILLIFNLTQINVLAKALIYFAITFPVLSGIGNILSILMPRGYIEGRKREMILSSIIIPLMTILLSSVPYRLFQLLAAGLQTWPKIFVALLFILLSFSAYYASLIKCAYSLNKNIFRLLQKL
ncbi:MAG: hypothetical protein HPY46_06715 [Candidatus Aminicenantes bacterium]|nr:hypothetical protein [Candidatus Aminicenantes bacterium]